MKIEDIEKALELKRKIEECQDDLKGLDVAADYRLEAIDSGYSVFSAYLQPHQVAAIKAMIQLDREEQIQAAIAELEKL